MKVGSEAYKGDVARTYDMDRENEPIWAEEQAWVSSYVSSLPSEATILDVPVGTGRFFDIFAKSRSRVTGVDISLEMLGVAAEKAEKRSFPADLCCGSVRSLSFADATFDHTICWRLWHLIPPSDTRHYLTELARVTKQEVVVQVFGVMTMRESAVTTVKEVIRKLRDILLRAHVGSGKKTPWSEIRAYSHVERRLLNSFRSCGLQVAAVDTLYYRPQSESNGRTRVRIYRLTKRR